MPPDPYADQYNHQTLKHHRAPSGGRLAITPEFVGGVQGLRRFEYIWQFGNLAHLARRKMNLGRRYSFGISYKVEQLCASGKVGTGSACMCMCVRCLNAADTADFLLARWQRLQCQSPVANGSDRRAADLQILSYWCLCKSHNQHQRLSSFVSDFSRLLF